MGQLDGRPKEGYPDWVPDDVLRYLGHTEFGHSIRQLARSSGLHASTVLRQVRRHEARREDPLVDRALVRLAVAHRHELSAQQEESNRVTKIAAAAKPAVPDEKTVTREARRILRRLAEPNACLAVAPGMDNAVVVREMPDARTVRTAVLDSAVAEALVLKDWIGGKSSGRIARYAITQAGRAALKRLLAEDEAARGGFAEAQSPFAEQHGNWKEREMRLPGSERTRRVRYNAAESPILSLSRRKDRDGKPFLSDELVAAGERLREDFELSQIGPRVAQNWERFLTAGDRGGFQTAGGGGNSAARDRVAAALKDLGPGLGDVALRCCCFLEGMEQAERRMGWSARSGKIVLRIALQRLKRHYEELGAAAVMIG